MLAETFCPPGKRTSIPVPPLVTAFVADPSVNTWIHASCGYLSAIVARVRDCFTVSSCVSPPEREGAVVWTLMSVMSITQVSDIPPLTKRLDSCEPPHFCDRCGPHRTSDQTECLVLDLVRDLLIGLCCG